MATTIEALKNLRQDRMVLMETADIAISHNQYLEAQALALMALVRAVEELTIIVRA